MSGPIQTLWKQVCRRPGCAVVIVVVLAGAVGAGGLQFWIWQQYGQAKLAAEQEKYQEARTSLNKCLAFWWWQTAENYLLAARLERLTGHFAAAEQYLEKSIYLRGVASEDTQLEAMLGLAETSDDFPQLEGKLQRLVETEHPDSAMILRTLAKVYKEQLRYQSALVALNVWVKLKPESAEALAWRGQVSDYLRNDDNALSDFQNALSLAPYRHEVRFALVQLLLRTHADPEEILKHLQVLLKEEPSYHEYLIALARCRVLQGEYAAARQILDQLAETEHLPASALFYRAEMEFQAGDFVSAENWARKAVEKNPNDVQALYLLSQSLKKQFGPQKQEAAQYQLKKYLQVKADAERFYELVTGPFDRDKDDPDILAELGSIFLRGGQDKTALFFLNKALTHDANHKTTHKLLANYYLNKNQSDKAAPHQKLAGVGSAK